MAVHIKVVNGPAMSARAMERASENEQWSKEWQFIGNRSYGKCFGKKGLNEMGGVQSSITHYVAVHVPVLWPVCAHKIPFRMLRCLWRFTIARKYS